MSLELTNESYYTELHVDTYYIYLVVLGQWIMAVDLPMCPALLNSLQLKEFQQLGQELGLLFVCFCLTPFTCEMQSARRRNLNSLSYLLES